MPLPNFPQMSLFSNGNSVLWDISWESSLLLFRPNQADLNLITDEIMGASGSMVAVGLDDTSGRSASSGGFLQSLFKVTNDRSW